MLTNINTQLFMLINASTDASKLTITFATFCAQYLIYLPVFIGIIYWFKKPSTREIILKTIVIVLISLIIAAILRWLIYSPRPFELGTGSNYLSHSSSNSFPSKHATFVFAIAAALFHYGKDQIKQNIFFIISLVIATLVCWSRIYLGVHWPFDILAAALVSSICAFVINQYWLALRVLALSLKKHLILIVFRLHTILFTSVVKNKRDRYVTKN